MRTTLGIALVGLAVALTGCSSASPASGPPAGAAPAAAASLPSQSAASSEAPHAASQPAPEVAAMSPEPFALTSTAFEDGGAIPRRFTCDDSNVSPDLKWSGVPEGTEALVLIVIDPDARNFVHWLAYDLEGAPAGGLPAGISSSPDAPPQGTNSFGKRGYGGPCPPSGTHHYRFTLSALDSVLEVTGTPRVDDLTAAMAGHVLAEATLTGTYRRS